MFLRMVIKTGKLINSFYNIFIVLILKRKKKHTTVPYSIPCICNLTRLLFLIPFPVSII